MKQDDTIEYNALGWVKKELDVELKQARQSLEAYIEDGDDGARLEQCGSHIRQAQGTLQMVELFGAAMLAEEMSELLQAVMDDKVSKKDDAYEALIRAIIQLPDYLEHIQAGNRDVPIVLLPLMNDLRAARGVPLLSENVLFFPDLDKTPSVPTAEVDRPPQPVQDNSKLNRALRHAYQLSLLGWFRDRDAEKSLKKMHAVLERLRQTAGRDETSRLWWIAGTLAQALALEGLESSVAVKQLLGKVDREIRLLIEKGEDELAQNIPEDVLKNLLYYLATSETVSEQIKEVKRAFKLSTLLPTGQDLEVAEGQVGGLNFEILQTVAEGIREDLTEIKDGLEVFVHSDDKSPDSLEPLADRLRKVADTLTMLGMGQARELVLKDEERIREMVSGAVAISDDALLNVAGVMLSVESALNSFIENRALPEDIEEIEAAAPPEAGRELPEAEYRDLLKAVIRETLAEMSKAKETILEFISDPTNVDCMQPVPDLLESIKGAMSMLPMERLVQVIESIQAYVGREVLARREMPASSKLEALADAITTVEMYLESLEENRGDHIQIIEFGEKSVSDLGYPAGAIPEAEEPLSEVQEGGEPDVEFVSEEEEALTVEMAMPSVQEEEVTEEIPHIPGIEEVEDEDVFDIGDLGSVSEDKEATVSTEVMDIGLPDETGEDEIEPTLVMKSLQAEDEEEELEPTQVMKMPSVEGEGEGEEEIEATLVMESLQPEVEEEFEAPEVTEFGLPEEAEIEPTQVMESLAPEAIEAETGEEEGLKLVASAEPVSSDDTLVTEVLDLPSEEASAEPLEEAEAAETAEIAQPAEPAEKPAVAAQAAIDDLNGEEFKDLSPIVGEMDEDILEIFLEEAQEEYERIQEFLPRWKNNLNDEEALTTIRRSFHTLKGSGRLVGAQLLGEFAWAFETLLNRIIDHTIRAEDFVFEALEESVAAISGLVEQIRDDKPLEIDAYALMAKAHAMAKGGYAEKYLGQSSEQQETEADLHAFIEEEDTPAGLVDEDLYRESEALAEVEPEEDEEDVPTIAVPAPSEDELRSLDESAAAEDLTPLSETEEIVEEAPIDEEIELSTETLQVPEYGEPVEGQGPEEGEDRGPFDQAESEGLAEAEPRIDPVLFEIYSQESEEHLETLRRLHDAAEASGEEITEDHDLIRALHTLNGSSRTADVPEIHEVCAPLERHVKNLTDLGEHLPNGQLPQLAATIEHVATILAGLADNAPELPDHQELASQLTALEQDSEARVAQAAQQGEEVSPEAGLSGAGEEAKPAEVEAQAEAEPQGKPDIAGEQDADLVEIFIEEAQEILDASDGTLQQWTDDVGDRDAVNELQRQLHTLKGGARMAGFTNIGDLSHAVESLIIKVVEGVVAPSSEITSNLHSAMDRLSDMVETASKNEPVYPAPALVEVLDGLRTGKPVEPAAAAAPEAEPETSESQAVAEPDAQPAPVPAEEPIATPVSRTETQGRAEPQEKASQRQAGQEVVRVRSDLLDNLVNFAGEVNIYHSRLEQQVNTFGFNLNEFDQTVARLREQLRRLEMETEAQIIHTFEQDKAAGEIEAAEDFDPLEMDKYSGIQQLSRALAESVNDLLSIQELLVEQVRDTETLLLQQSRVSTELQEGLMRTRMVQFSGIGPRLRRIVRQTAGELNKKVDLEIIGEHSDLDRSVLDHMVAPLEHLIRNAISHGIELPDERLSKGKPEAGKLMIVVRREGAEIIIEVSDDGAGIDLDKVRTKARKLGMIGTQDDLSDEDAMQLILDSGFSTADSVSQISGRGVGMDVVNNEIKQLGGVLVIDSARGRGTTFKVNLPFTLAINQALMVQTGEELYAVPLNSIEGIVRIPAGELATRYDEKDPVIEYAAYDYELKHLNTLLSGGEPHLNDPNVMFPVLLVHSGGHRLALQVEGLLGSREVVVKSVGPQFSKVRGISGATILGDGRVVLILDMPTLVRMSTGIKLVYTAPEAEEVVEEAATPKVMVVDDSITIRKVTSRMLERNNFQVMTAKDGVDAVSTLQDEIPDLMLLDIEMPRMDGYELATYIRNDSRLREIPIIMITSRTGEKHRQRAMDIGVNQYLGKPYQESELLDEINSLLGQQA